MKQYAVFLGEEGRDGRSVIAGKEQKVVEHLDGVTEAIVVDKYLVYFYALHHV
ncbi:MAG: hypothetical protein ACLTJ5_06760 [Clostridium sp.]